MTQVNILVGVAGSGKSTFISNNIKTNDVHLSSDNIRKELYGDLYQNDPKKVFDLMKERLFNAIDQNVTNIWYDATNISRKNRRTLYNSIKQYKNSVNVRIICIFASLPTILKQNNLRRGLAKVPENVIKRMYFNLEVPRLTVDCDEIVVINNSKNILLEDLEYHYDDNHYSPYHHETITQHIQWCIEHARQTHNQKLIEIAKYHDDGKFITQTDVENPDVASQLVINKYGRHCQYIGHANVSAMYYLANNYANNSEINTDVLEITECIFQHMNAHNGISKKNILNNKLTPSILDLIEQFAKIDDLSRVVEESLLQDYIALKKLKKLKQKA